MPRAPRKGPQFCVMAELFKPGRSSSRTACVNGPFADSQESVVSAFLEYLRKKGWDSCALFHVFIAEKQPRETADMANSKFGYKSATPVLHVCSSSSDLYRALTSQPRGTP